MKPCKMKIKQVGVSHEGWDEFLVGESDMGLDWIASRKESFAQQMVYIIKNEHDGSKRYKAKLVVKGFQQKKGIDYS